MNILIPDSWLREYLTTNATPKDIQRCLSLCGPSIERMQEIQNADGQNEYVYDIEVTTNRVDCMSVYGIAREATAILPQFGFSAQLKPLTFKKIKNGPLPNFSIANNPELCQRILALPVTNLKVEASPSWLQEKLIAVGQRPLNNLIDITNYVMWEIGHPTHVFDLHKLSSHKMVIREAIPNEKLTTLDEQTHTMIGKEVVIDDGTGNIIDLPSVMGTANSVVSSETTSALFFVDHILNTRVRFASTRHAIRTQAAILLEKDVDPNLGLTAILRIAQLIKVICPKAKIGLLYDDYPLPKKPTPISFPISQISKLIGEEISNEDIKTSLSKLGFTTKLTKTTLTTTPPTWRQADITLPQDVTEEIARLYGYHNITPTLMTGKLPSPSFNDNFYWESRLKTALKYLGFTEVYTYSLTTNKEGLRVSNPLSSDWEYLRTSLFPSHQIVCDQNVGKSKNLNIFEIANVYLSRPGDLPTEESRLILTVTNRDYYSFKGTIQALLHDIGILNYEPKIKTQDNVMYWEIPVAELLSHATDIKTYIPISKFTPIIEDFNISYTPPYAKIVTRIKAISPLITNIELIDKFQSKITLRITFHSITKQLSSSDLSDIRKQIGDI